MALGLLVYDVMFIALATALYGGALAAASSAYRGLGGVLPCAFAVFPSMLAGLVVLVAEVSILTALCPRLRPGRHEVMKGRVFFGWVIRSMLRRVVFVPGLRWFLFSSNMLRFLTLRGLGARVPFSMNMSVDVDILDPSLFVAGPGATLGARCIISGHYIEDDTLVLGEVRVGRGSLIAAEVGCAPGVVIGEQVLVKARAALSVGARVEDRAIVGADSVIDAYAVLGAGAETDNRVHVKVGTRVPSGTKVTQ